MRIMKINTVNYFNTTDYSTVIETVLQHGANVLELKDVSINIILVDNNEITRLNKQYRDKDYATDVLTFPDGVLHHLGDVFISLDKCQTQAIDFGHSFDRELGFLAVHGFLHTLGYDHHTPDEETIMVELQERILRKAKLYR